ncbi:MAG TPA: immunoglobulin domain-containing protein, partial [Candidatus Dormibacteraeota bacterium]|nr:immunoglobulin domain-containing protein [Candidatus Dormibacteraeota bacterium]
MAAAQNDTIYGCSLTAPVIYNPPTSRTVVAGTRVTLSVGASGAAPLAYQWQLNGVDLLSETNAVLAIPNVPIAASGRRYVVRVSNTLGSVLSTEAVLTVVPAFVSTEPPGGLTPTGVVFKGSVTPGAGPTAVWFQWGTDTDYGAATAPMNPGVSFDALSFANSITGLSPATVYHYRAVASSQLGTVLGADVSFLTPGLPFTQSSAPLKNWLSVASSADGTKLAAVATFGSGGFPGQIFISTNSGATWTLTDAPTEGWNIVASSADGSRLAALPGGVDLECWGSGGGGYGPIYISTNSGATWAASSSSMMRWTGAAASADGMKWVAVASDWSLSAPGLIY